MNYPCGCRLRAPFTPLHLCDEARRLLALCTDPPPLEGPAWEAFAAHFAGQRALLAAPGAAGEEASK